MDAIFSIEAGYELPIWIERVPGNPANVLSREVVPVLGSARRVEVDPWEMWCLLASTVLLGTAAVWEGACVREMAVSLGYHNLWTVPAGGASFTGWHRNFLRLRKQHRVKTVEYKSVLLLGAGNN